MCLLRYRTPCFICHVLYYFCSGWLNTPKYELTDKRKDYDKINVIYEIIAKLPDTT